MYNQMVIHQSTQLDGIFHALSDATRRNMLALLAKSDRTAGELGEPFQITQPACSKHIAVLERSGLIKRSVDGRVHRFRLQPGPMRNSETWIASHRQLWEGSFKQLDSLLADLQKSGDV